MSRYTLIHSAPTLGAVPGLGQTTLPGSAGKGIVASWHWSLEGSLPSKLGKTAPLGMIPYPALGTASSGALASRQRGTGCMGPCLHNSNTQVLGESLFSYNIIFPTFSQRFRFGGGDLVRMLLPDLVAEMGVGVGSGKKVPSSILPLYHPTLG